MNVADLIGQDRVIVDLRVATKPQLLAELAKQAAARVAVEAPAVLAALSARERLGSTGFGRGFALPHARVIGVDRMFGLFTRLAQPIDFEAIDGEAVDLVFLLLIPPSGTDHVAALAAVSRRMREEGVPQKARKASGAAEFYRIVTGPAP